MLNYTTATPVEVFGGKGGNTGYLNYDFGPGGGGGGGVVWSSPSGSIASLTTNVSGGNAGISGSGGGNGSGTTWNAANGSAGAVLNNLSMPISSTGSSCTLPVDLIFFKAHYTGRYTVETTWATAKEEKNAFFTLEKSIDGVNFYTLYTSSGKGDSNTKNEYGYTDEVSYQEIIYYRLWQTDTDGTTANLGVQCVYPNANHYLIETIYPNPFENILNVQLPIGKKTGIQNAYLTNTMGEVFSVLLHQENEMLCFDTTTLQSGLYTLVLQENDRMEYFKVVKK